jgi:hypothetical protein
MNEIYDYLESNVKPNENAMCMMPGTEIIKSNTDSFWIQARPNLYPFGIGSPKSKRPIHVPFDEIVQHCLLSCNYHARDFFFQFAAYDILLKQQVFSSIYYKVKNMSADVEEKIANITPNDIEKTIEDRRKGSYNAESNYLNNILNVVGGKAPFCQISKQTNRRELKSMIIFHGNANLYVTLSPDDTKHPLAYKLCMDDPNNFAFSSKELNDDQFRALQTSKNPIGISQFFYNLITIIIDHLFGWKNHERDGIFGKIKAYYGMVETQARGTLHVHLLLWIHGSPSPIDLYNELQKNEQLRHEMLSYLSKIIHTGDRLEDHNCIPDMTGVETQEQIEQMNLECESCAITDKMKSNPAYKHFPDPDDEEFFHLLCHRLYNASSSYQFH